MSRGETAGGQRVFARRLTEVGWTEANATRQGAWEDGASAESLAEAPVSAAPSDRDARGARERIPRGNDGCGLWLQPRGGAHRPSCIIASGARAMGSTYHVSWTFPLMVHAHYTWQGRLESGAAA